MAQVLDRHPKCALVSCSAHVKAAGAAQSHLEVITPPLQRAMAIFSFQWESQSNANQGKAQKGEACGKLVAQKRWQQQQQQRQTVEQHII